MEKVKRKKEVGINYMKSWEYEKMIKDEAFKDGFNDGIEQTNQLTLLLAAEGRTEDIIRAAQDPAYRTKLLEEFHLV